jgi:hypothetical protein
VSNALYQAPFLIFVILLVCAGTRDDSSALPA